MPLGPGTRLGPYEILSPLGAGGMGEVYRARDARLNRSVAIKVLPSDLASDPDRRGRFEREAHAIAALSHPHICTIFDVGRENGTDYLVMELLEGETLADRLAGRPKGRPLPVQEVFRYAIEIADALDKAHRAGIVHRDLKPANIMLTKSGVKLLDFGLAKLKGHAAPISMTAIEQATTAGGPKTATGTILGTVHYMAPEQVEGREADSRSDIWALGVVIYEMATGERPFEGESAASIIGAILKDTPAAISSRQPLSPPSLDHIVEQCLDKDPDERWQDVGDVKRELTWAVKSGGAASQVAVGATRRGSSLGWVLSAVLAIALAVTALFALRSRLSVTPDPSPVRFNVFPSDGTTFSGLGASVPTTQFAVSPDGRHLAFVASATGGRPMLWIRSLDAVEAHAIYGTEDAAYPFWSPDSRFVGFLAQGKLKKADLAGGNAQALCDAPSADPRGATWNRDGVILFSPSSTSPLLTVSAAGGPPTVALPLREGDSSYRWPAFLPDGHHFLFYVRSSSDRRGVYVGSLGSTTATRVLDTGFNAIYAAGYLLSVREGSLLAYPFDEKRLQIVGDPVQVADHVGGSSTQLGAFSLSAGGVLAHTPGLTTSSRLTWFDRDGKSSGSLTEVGDYTTFRFSPDEKRLAFSKVDSLTITSDIWLMDVARGVPTRFTSDPLNDLSPDWSPDGTRIVFRSDRAGGNFMFEKLSSGAEPERVVAPLEVTFPTDWSPDGKFILYHSPEATTGSQDVMLLPASGERKPIAFANSKFTEASGHFSPDGHWIAYSSDESGRSEIYVQTFPKSGSPIRVTTNGGFEPQWRRDGKELFYLALDGTMTAVPVSTAPQFESGTPKGLFQTHVPFLGSFYRAHYEVVDNGRRFLVNTIAEGTSSPPVTVVVNWTAGLKK